MKNIMRNIIEIDSHEYMMPRATLLGCALCVGSIFCAPTHAADDTIHNVPHNVAPLAKPLADCMTIADDTLRLRCYDAAAKKLVPPEDTASENKESIVTVGEDKKLVPVAPIVLGVDNETAANTTSSEKTPVASKEEAIPDDKSEALRGWLARSWDLDMKDTNDRFSLRPYRANYMLPMHYDFRLNQSPKTPTRDETLLYEGNAKKAEALFQISLKSRVWNDVFGSPLDLWVGYTQRSFWQIYNTHWSSPFRETDYEPEIIATVPVRVPVAWIPLRMIGFGAVHQSNGQSGSLSRSWNRVYGMLGFERGHWGVVARGWYRIPEARSTDDNPDITKYMGHGDVVAHYQWREFTIDATTRLNLKTGHGAAQLDFTFPISGFLRGYIQYFDGYGESLIDYNHRSRSLGTGVYISDWKLK